MHFSSHTLSSPAENLALEEAWLDMAEEGEWDAEILRLWQPESNFVVIGRGSRMAEEVNLPATRAAGIPVLRRSSGGAAIVAGPGCMMYALLLSYQRRPQLRLLDHAHQTVMETFVSALQPLAPQLTWRGTCDLVVPGVTADGQGTYRKVSGNSLRCRREWLLYHGTLLLSMDLALADRFLLHPPREPEYRQKRRHADFIANLDLPVDKLIESLKKGWQAEHTSSPPLPQPRIEQLVAERYANEAWNQQR